MRASALFLALLFGVLANASEPAPLVLKDQGSLIAGGTVVTQPGTFDPISPTRPDGQTYHGDHVYAFYQIPINARPLPIVMWHGAGGDVKLTHLPEIGIKGNTHFPFSDRNNVDIADLVSTFLAEKQLDR